MRWLSQIVAITWLNLLTIRQRLGASFVAMFGIAGVVAVFVAVLSIAEGFQKVMMSTGSADTAIVMREGADSEMTSVLSRQDVVIIGDAAGVKRTETGAASSPELFVIVDVAKKSAGTEANVPLRGVHPAAFAVRPEVRIVRGRRFEPGRNEVIVGRGAAEQYVGLEVGRSVRWGQNTWTIVGVFDADGTLPESEVWTDAAVLQPAYQRGTTYQVVYAKLETPEAFTAFKDVLTTDPRLKVKVLRETEYFAEQTVILKGIITTLGALVAGLMGIGAVFGSLNTMYAAVAARTREIAMLRAIGFGSAPVVVSVLAEALVLAVIGGTAGALLAYVAFNGFKTSTMNWQSFSMVTFAFAVTPALLVQGVVYSVVMGLVGGLFPAIRAARLPIVAALREL